MSDDVWVDVFGAGVLAVTVMVYVPGAVPGFGAGSFPVPPDPQAAIPTASAAANANIETCLSSALRRYPERQPRAWKLHSASHISKASQMQASAKDFVVGPAAKGGEIAEVGATVGTLTVNCPAAVGVTCTDGGFVAGVVAMAQGPSSEPAGATEHDRFTVPENPPLDAISSE